MFYTTAGPCFGDGDIAIYSSKESVDYEKIFCEKACYERKIRDSVDDFSIEDYEVFQIIKK